MPHCAFNCKVRKTLGPFGFIATADMYHGIAVGMVATVTDERNPTASCLQVAGHGGHALVAEFERAALTFQ